MYIIFADNRRLSNPARAHGSSLGPRERLAGELLSLKSLYRVIYPLLPPPRSSVEPHERDDLTARRTFRFIMQLSITRVRCSWYNLTNAHFSHRANAVPSLLFPPTALLRCACQHYFYLFLFFFCFYDRVFTITYSIILASPLSSRSYSLQCISLVFIVSVFFFLLKRTESNLKIAGGKYE